MNKIPTAEEFCRNYTRLRSAMAIQDLTECMNEYAKLHVKAALKAAAKDAEIDLNGCCEEEEFECSATVDKNSILNAYPENLIQ